LALEGRNPKRKAAANVDEGSTRGTWRKKGKSSGKERGKTTSGREADARLARKGGKYSNGKKSSLTTNKEEGKDAIQKKSLPVVTEAGPEKGSHAKNDI